jgi:hypothetical protein
MKGNKIYAQAQAHEATSTNLEPRITCLVWGLRHNQHINKIANNNNKNTTNLVSLEPLTNLGATSNKAISRELRFKKI